MAEHAVVIAGAGPAGLMLAGELALAGVDVALVERRLTLDLAGSRAGGLHSRTIEVLDQRGIADRFLSRGQLHPAVVFHMVPLGISDFPLGIPTCLHCGRTTSSVFSPAGSTNSAYRRTAGAR
jgi:3-(3-hydroxy-phenyl)propionate hydroxylase